MRVIHAGREDVPALADAVPIWGSGVILKGRLLEAGRESITLVSSLAGEPLTCSREGLASLHFLSSGNREDEPGDMLRTADFTLKGKMEIREGGEPFWWLPEGAVEAQPLAGGFAGRIERRDAAPGEEGYPHRIQLCGNMSIPCRFISLDQDRMEIDAPCLGRRSIDIRHLRALELDRRRAVKPDLAKDGRNGLSSGADPVENMHDRETAARIEEALRISRSRAGQPPICWLPGMAMFCAATWSRSTRTRSASVPVPACGNGSWSAISSVRLSGSTNRTERRERGGSGS